MWRKMKAKEPVGEALKSDTGVKIDTRGGKKARLLPGSTLVKHVVIYMGLLLQDKWNQRKSSITRSNPEFYRSS